MFLWSGIAAECHYIGAYVGHDIGSEHLPEKFIGSWNECQKMCQANKFCKFWTYDSLNGDCWMKDGFDGEPLMRPHLDMVSGPSNCNPSKFGR